MVRTLALLAALLAVAPAAAQPTVEVVYWDSPIQSPCNGETIRYYGEVELRRHERPTKLGGQRVSVTIGYRWLEAVGEESGLVYDVTGGFHHGHSFSGPQAGETYVNRLHFTAPGGGNDVHYDELLHVTVNPRGELVVTRDHFSVDCR
jgi:hypothetical protein